jgi:hypothetical protein
MASRQDMIAAAIQQAKQPSVHLSSAAHVGAPLPDASQRKGSAAAAHEPAPAPVNPRAPAAGSAAAAAPPGGAAPSGATAAAAAAAPSAAAPSKPAASTSTADAPAVAAAAARAALASLPPGATASEALATGAVDLLTYVPRSGATGDRFTAALAASASPVGLASDGSSRGGSSSGAPSPAPFVSRASVAKAPVGLPPSPAPTPSGSGSGSGGFMSRLSTLLPGPASGAAVAKAGGSGSGGGGDDVTSGVRSPASSAPGVGGGDGARPLPAAAARRRDDPHAAEAAHSGAVSRERARLEALRADKWLAMLRDWPGWMASEAKRTKVRDRCRKGIPEALRGAAWQAIIGSPAVRDACGGPGAYRRLLSLKLKGSGGVPPAPLAEAAPQAASGAAGAARRPVSSWGKSSGSGAPSATAAAVAAVAAHQAHQHKAAKVRLSAAAGTPPLPSVPALFAALAGATEGHAGPDVIDTIERDINRTYPQFALFSEVGGIGESEGVESGRGGKGGCLVRSVALCDGIVAPVSCSSWCSLPPSSPAPAGQTSLFRVLVAYAHLNGVVGYCQGMGFIAALFLSYMPEEEAFWAFVTGA